MSYLTDDLAMASINMAKVVDIDKVVIEAEDALNNHRLSEENHSLIKNTLNSIKETKDYEVTPEFVEETDKTINDVSSVVVNEEGKSDLVVVTGTEQFGFTLTPKAWKENRIAGCESLIDELTKNMKRWSNQLIGKLNELWTSNFYNINSLKERLLKLDEYMANTANKKPVKQFVHIPSEINKTLSLKGKTLTTNVQIDTLLKNEINLIFTTIKIWNLESVDFKNRFIRFFGNKTRAPLKLLERKHNNFFSKKLYVDDDDDNIVAWTIHQLVFIGDGGINFLEYKIPFENLSDAAASLEKTKYEIFQSKDVNWKYDDLNNNPLNFNQLNKIYDLIVKIISILEGLNQKENDFNLMDKDVKDVLSTLRALDDPLILDSYAGISTHYQLNTTATQTGFIKYLHNLASHLITFTLINLDGYHE